MDYTDFLELIELAGNGNDEPTGVAYSEVGAGVYLVMAWLENDSAQGYVKVINRKSYTLMGKLAYNCDDLQCDYDYDWYMFTDKDGNVFDSENYVYPTEQNYKEWKELIEDVIKGVESGVLVKG